MFAYVDGPKDYERELEHFNHAAFIVKERADYLLRDFFSATEKIRYFCRASMRDFFEIVEIISLENTKILGELFNTIHNMTLVSDWNLENFLKLLKQIVESGGSLKLLEDCFSDLNFAMDNTTASEGIMFSLGKGNFSAMDILGKEPNPEARLKKVLDIWKEWFDVRVEGAIN
jgi:hypothetical protein